MLPNFWWADFACVCGAKVGPPLARRVDNFSSAGARLRCPPLLQHGLKSRQHHAQERSTPIMEHGNSVGLIGMGDMGKMYARRLSSAGWK